MLLPMVLVSPPHKDLFQVFHLNPVVKSFWPMEVDRLVFHVPQAAASRRVMITRKVIDPFVSSYRSGGAF